MTETNISYSGEIITRQDAKAAGKKRYFTGKPCTHGHIAQRQTAGSICVICNKLRLASKPGLMYEYAKKWREKNSDKRREESRRRNAKPHIREAAAKRYLQKKLFEPERLKREIAASKALKEDKLADLAGRPRPQRCEVCLEQRRIVFDHCHISGKFRGWICSRCNTALGMVDDSKLVLRRLVDYLESNDV